MTNKSTGKLVMGYAMFVLVALALSGCGGGGDSSTSIPATPVTPPAETSEALTLPTGHGLAVGEFTLQPGVSDEYGNVVVSCPAGGNACVVTVAADGTASYDRTGGVPGVMAAYGPWELPSGHGLASGTFTVQPGASDEYGNVVVSCPSGGSACVVTVAADGTASYDRTGGVPGVMAAYGPWELPSGHGLASGTFTVQSGASDEYGNVVVSCPSGGSACVVTVAADGTASYDRTGGVPGVMAAYGPWELPSGHGLASGTFTVQSGASDEYGNVVVSCPSGGSACVVTVAADGTAAYDRTGGMPTIMAAYQPWNLPTGHGLSAGEIRVAPGASEELGNVVVSCPAGGAACVVTVAADGTASYDRTGGVPGVMAAYGAWALPTGHGLVAGTITVAAGGSAEHGNVVVSCPAGGPACMVTVAADGTATYDRAGGVPTAALATPVVNLEFGSRTDNPSAERVADYFRVFLGGIEDGASQYREPGFTRFSSPPTVRLMDGGTNKERALLYHAVGLINRELPQHLHLRIGSDAPHIGHVEDTEANTDTIPNGEMFVYFSDPQSAGYEDGVDAGGFANINTWDRSQIPWIKRPIRAAFVWVNDSARISQQHRLGILLHEMMHALGFYAHVYAEDHPSSLIGPSGPKDSGLHHRWGSQLPEIDGAALRAAYRLPNGITPDQFSVSSLGDWETTSIEIRGSIATDDAQPLRFGVNLTNDVAVPWTSGIIPETDLADNRALSGSATWTGELLGFTPDLRGVRGNAEIGVNLATLNGTADFTDLQSWATGQAPGEIGTGEQWNTGSLNYTLQMSGNFLRSTGGANGVLIGQFYGSSHEGVAGSIERSDLTAAFGAMR